MTGIDQVRYCDVAYLKEVIKSQLLGGNEKNIQMLTCFSLENALNGLVHVLTEKFNTAVKIETILVDSEQSKLVSRKETTVAQFIKTVGEEKEYSKILAFNLPNSVIYLDLFVPNKVTSLQVQTLTEQGHSLYTSARPSAYMTDCMRPDALLLSFNQF